MYEASNQWTIVGSDGTTVQLNDGASGITVEQISGFDSPNVRTNVEDASEVDGAVFGDFWFGQRPFTLTGHIGVSVDPGTRNQQLANLQRALRGLRSSFTLKTQSTGMPAMQLAARLQQLRVGEGYVKTIQISAIAADPRFYSQALNTNSVIGIAATPGAAFPWAFPVDFGGGSGATLTVSATNAGNFPTQPQIKIWGPITNPQVIKAATAEQLLLSPLTLAAGEWALVDMAARTITKSDGTSLYGKLVFPGSTWFQLDPGSNNIQLWGSGATSATEMDVTWRDAWC